MSSQCTGSAAWHARPGRVARRHGPQPPRMARSKIPQCLSAILDGAQRLLAVGHWTRGRRRGARSKARVASENASGRVATLVDTLERLDHVGAGHLTHRHRADVREHNPTHIFWFLSGIGAALAGSMANKSSIVIDLRGWRTPSVWRGTAGSRKVRPTVHGGNREGPASSKGLNSQRGFGPAVKRRRKSRPRSTSVHGSSPCKCQRFSTLRWDRLPSSRPPTKSGARAGGRRLSDRRLHR